MLVLIGILVKILIVVGVTQGAVAYLILVERKVAAYAQDRIGPNRCGREFGLPFGLLQPLADGAKMLLKEDVIPSYVSKPIFILAPSIAIIAAMIGFAVVPFGPVGPGALAPPAGAGRVPDRARDRRRDRLHLRGRQPGGLRRDPGGWASNNKYSFLGGLRSSAQLISYEIPLGMSILGMVLLARSLDLNTIVNWQDSHVWGIFVQPIGCLLFLIERLRRDQPAALRPPRGRARTGRRLSHRVFGDEVRHVLPRRIPACDHGELPDGHPLLRRLGRAVSARPAPGRVGYRRWPRCSC